MANEFHEAVTTARAEGRLRFDLTVSNPTRCGFLYDNVLPPLNDGSALQYRPDPIGMPSARAAVSCYYAELGVADVAVGHICLTTSTSEAYSFLFRLLCDPGDEVLAAEPSYPLFDDLALLDDVILRKFPLFYDPAGSGWHIDLQALAAAITPRTRAIILVHPNNPTGSFVSDPDGAAVRALCRAHGLALIVDEVFLDFVPGSPRWSSFLQCPERIVPPLTFVLSGISKVCGLPQMKVSWIAATGPEDDVRAAMERLEIIADTFLSLNAPAQLALPTWLIGRHAFHDQVKDRMRANLASLDDRLRNSLGDRLAFQGGWTVVLRVPRAIEGRPFAMAALECGVLVQTGELYGLPEGRAVLSLLTPPDEWRDGLATLPL